MDRLLVEQIVANEGPSVAVAYLLAIFLGLFSAHRFYLRRPGSALLQIFTYFMVVGFIWLLIDLFAIPGMVRAERDKIRRREIARLADVNDDADNPGDPPLVDAALVARLIAAQGPV